MNCSALWYTKGEAESATHGDIELALCRRCGMIFNAAFERAHLEYNATYDNTLTFSPAFRLYAENLAQRLVSSAALKNKKIIEVGCGSGQFLDRLCEIGNNAGIGFDPSALARNTAGQPEIVAEIFSPSIRTKGADFVCCRHVLEHIEAPRELLNSIHDCLADRRGIVYCEVPNAASVLDGATTWDLIYPHCSYFTAPALAYLFESCGFEVTGIGTAFGDQFLWLEARIDERNRTLRIESRDVTAVCRLADRFESKLRTSIFQWSRLIEYASVEGRRVLLWGAGAKGVSFLNIVPGAERILAVVDLNPRKQGAFIPCTGQPIIGPDRISEYKPDLVIALNPLYEAEIRQTIMSLGVEALVMVNARLPLPTHERAPLRRAAAGYA